MLLSNNNNNEHGNVLLRFAIYDGIDEKIKLFSQGTVQVKRNRLGFIPSKKYN